MTFALLPCYNNECTINVIVLVYLVPHAIFNYDVNVTWKITEVYYFTR